MLTAIDNSIVNLCDDLLEATITKGKNLGKNLHGASISLTCNDKESNYYLFLKKDTLKEFAYSLLGEDGFFEEEINDLCKEIANLIVGQAKTNLDDKYPKNSYKLGTPKYLGCVSSPLDIKFSDSVIYKLKNRTFLLGVKVDK